jgi:hypothetical protein
MATRATRPEIGNAAYQAFLLLRIGFTAAPILFGLDKFFNWTVDWPQYLAPWVNDIIPGSGQDFMYFVPWLGAPVVAAWLGGIIINLLTANPPEYYDIALRDFGLMLGALTLARLAFAFHRSGVLHGADDQERGLRRAA